MQQITSPKPCQEWCLSQKQQGKTIGFVATMGALHAGHMALVAAAQQACDVVVVSIFINPLQFDQLIDLNNYPQTLAADLAMLESAGVDAVFVPNQDELYPQDFNTHVSVPYFKEMLCGKARPGHFAGVATVVCKLFNITQPTKAFFGEKDYQQFVLLRQMVVDLNMTLEVVAVPTVREADGLAMSSRNTRLTDNGRKIAAGLPKVLANIKSEADIEPAKQQLLNAGFEHIDYLEIRDSKTLQRPNNKLGKKSGQKNNRVFAAGLVEGVRLIDNMAV